MILSLFNYIFNVMFELFSEHGVNKTKNYGNFQIGQNGYPNLIQVTSK